MDLKKHLSLFVLFFLALSTTTYATAFAEVIYLGMDCGNGGEVEFALNGDPDDFTYNWEHGPLSLHLTGLEPGIYTLHVRSRLGCEESYDVEILTFENCFTLGKIAATDDDCIFEVDIFILNGETTERYDLSLFVTV